jgi:hypothetical protein
MMQRIIYVAVFLLIIQVGLIVALNSGDDRLDVKAPDTAFVGFTPSEITTIEITDNQNQQLILDRKESSWLISSSFSAPAEEALINTFLDKLANAKQGFAIATSSGAAERFKTAKEGFESHILLRKGDQLVTDIYLGTSAGMRRSHVRRAGEKEVYTIGVSSFEVDTDPDRWFDKNAFKIEEETLKGLQIADIELSREGDSWLVADANTEKVIMEEIEKLIKAVTGLSVQSILDPNEVKTLFDNEPDLQFTVSAENKEPIQYSFVQQEDYSVLKISDSDLYFKVFSWQVDTLSEFRKEKLLHNEDDAVMAEPTNISE